MPAQSAFRNQDALTVFGEIGNEQIRTIFSALVDSGAGGDEKLDIPPVLAGAIRAFTVSAAACGEDLLEAVIEERVEVGVDDQEDRSAWTAVSAARSAARNEFLAAESHGAPAAMTGRDVDINFVYKHAKADLTLLTGGR